MGMLYGISNPLIQTSLYPFNIHKTRIQQQGTEDQASTCPFTTCNQASYDVAVYQTYSNLFSWVIGFIMRRGDPLRNGREWATRSVWGRGGGEDITTACACPGGSIAHRPPELLLPAFRL
jgi:hypothetical protein